MYVDQNFDTYSVEYTYADGTKFFFDGRTIAGCEHIYSSYLQGTKGSGIASWWDDSTLSGKDQRAVARPHRFAH